jgi:hypothetical protein
MSWRNHSDDKDCDPYHVLYRDDGVALGCVLRIPGGHSTHAFAYIATHDVLLPIGACSSDEEARRAAEHAAGTEDGAL